MPQISVLIAGKTYRMACGEGEEARLEGLAAMLDGKISEMRAAFGEIGDMRLQVMAAITFADLLLDAQTRIGALEAEKAELVTLLANADERRQASEDKIAVGIARAAERVERLAKSLAIGQPSNAQGAAPAGDHAGEEPGSG